MRAVTFRSGWRARVAVVAAALLLSVAACRQGVPVIDLAPRPPSADGTISGTVRGPQGTTAMEGRTVEVINIDTGERQRLATSNTGGFTFKVKPGKYRVQLHLQPGETLVRAPGVIDVNRSDVDADADFVIGVARTARPKSPRLRGDDGLGAPIA